MRVAVVRVGAHVLSQYRYVKTDLRAVSAAAAGAALAVAELAAATAMAGTAADGGDGTLGQPDNLYHPRRQSFAVHHVAAVDEDRSAVPAAGRANPWAEPGWDDPGGSPAQGGAGPEVREEPRQGCRSVLPRTHFIRKLLT
jgi:hypothetical protein